MQQPAEACRTRELSAELTVTRVYWRKQDPPPPRVRRNFESFSSCVPKISQNFAAHGGSLLTPMVTSEFLLSR